jgi:hypothetical protein
MARALIPPLAGSLGPPGRSASALGSAPCRARSPGRSLPSGLSSLPRSWRPPSRPGLCSSSRTRSMLPAASSVSVGGSGRPNGHAGLWHLLWAAAAQGGLSARWVPAHRDGPSPPLLSLVDWEGNAEAGRLVGVALAAAHPPPQLLATAAAAELAYSAAVAVGAAALEAQLAWAHAGVVDGPTGLPSRVRFQAPRAVGARPAWVREYHQLHGSGRGMVACARCGLGTQASRALQVGTRVCVARRRAFTPMTGELSSSRFLVGAAALRRPRGLPSSPS